MTRVTVESQCSGVASETRFGLDQINLFVGSNNKTIALYADPQFAMRSNEVHHASARQRRLYANIIGEWLSTNQGNIGDLKALGVSNDPPLGGEMQRRPSTT